MVDFHRPGHIHIFNFEVFKNNYLCVLIKGFVTSLQEQRLASAQAESMHEDQLVWKACSAPNGYFMAVATQWNSSQMAPKNICINLYQSVITPKINHFWTNSVYHCNE